jgi:hypothetical protein
MKAAALVRRTDLRDRTTNVSPFYTAAKVSIGATDEFYSKAGVPAHLLYDGDGSDRV